MRKLLFIILIAFCFSCDSPLTCDEPDPNAPYGTPDDITSYEGTGGYKSITYTYYCLNAQYIAVTYTRVDKCTKYESSVFTSTGICK